MIWYPMQPTSSNFILIIIKTRSEISLKKDFVLFLSLACNKIFNESSVLFA